MNEPAITPEKNNPCTTSGEPSLPAGPGPEITYSSGELSDEQVRAMWAAHPGIEDMEIIDSL